MSADPTPGTEPGEPNVRPAPDTQTRDIIFAGFGIIGALGALYLFMPQEGGKEVILAIIGGITGFLAGRKKS